MDNPTKLILGGIYKTEMHPDPLRVIAFDKYEVFYDAYWPTLDKWTFSTNLRGKSSYYRITPSIFLKAAKFIREQPLTDQEFIVFRPDLPFRLSRCQQIQWTIGLYDNIELYKSSLEVSNVKSLNEIVLETPEIVLCPYGPKGGGTKATKISAINKQGFTNIELLWNAQNLQAIHLKENSKNGVGLFRRGHEKMIPSYYIGNYFDKAGNLKD